MPTEPATKRTFVFVDGSTTTVLVGQEKGIDVRLALDIVRLAREAAFDVAIVLSQDQDLSEVADEVKQISIAQKRWIRIASAFPARPATAPGRVRFPGVPPAGKGGH